MSDQSRHARQKSAFILFDPDLYKQSAMTPQDYPVAPHFNISFPDQYVAHVEINRPTKLNAFSPPMWSEIGAIFSTLSVDPDVRVVLLTGAGDRAFTAGLDVTSAMAEGPLSSTGTGDPARKAAILRRHIEDYQQYISKIEKCEKPVIAVLHGISYGLAIDMTCCCDVRLCAQDARFSVREVAIGLAADVGTLSRLPYAGVGMSWIKDVCLTGREFGADEAARVGFVSGVYPTKRDAVEKGRELARAIAANSPVAVQSTKEVINFSRDHTIADGKISDHDSLYIKAALLIPNVLRPQVSTMSRYGTLQRCRLKMSRTPCCRASKRQSRSLRNYEKQYPNHDTKPYRRRGRSGEKDHEIAKRYEDPGLCISTYNRCIFHGHLEALSFL